MGKQQLSILLTVDPELPVPPGLYGGIERIVEMLIHGLIEHGHKVTLCANPKSTVPCQLIPWRGMRSQHLSDSIQNAITLTAVVAKERFDIVHSFSRLAYMTAIMPFSIPKIMSYQREPSTSQIKKAVSLSRKGSIVFTGCSDYITNQIKPVATAYTIYNGVPIEKYDLVTETENDAPLIFLGRIEEIKGTHIAVEIARRTNRRLVIAGNIPPEGKVYFDTLVKPFLNDHINYIGPVDDYQKKEWLSKSSALLMPIQWNEPFGIVMAEAMACGTPVICFPKGAVPEVVMDGINGYVCNDIEDMIKKVHNIKAIDRRKVRQIVEERFSNKKITTDYLAIYYSLINRNKLSGQEYATKK